MAAPAAEFFLDFFAQLLAPEFIQAKAEKLCEEKKRRPWNLV
jgi:hypothetical protein